MPSEDHSDDQSDDRTRCSKKTLLREHPSCIWLGIEYIRLHKLADIEKTALETTTRGCTDRRDAGRARRPPGLSSRLAP